MSVFLVKSRAIARTSHLRCRRLQTSQPLSWRVSSCKGVVDRILRADLRADFVRIGLLSQRQHHDPVSPVIRPALWMSAPNAAGSRPRPHCTCPVGEDPDESSDPRDTIQDLRHSPSPRSTANPADTAENEPVRPRVRLCCVTHPLRWQPNTNCPLVRKPQRAAAPEKTSRRPASLAHPLLFL